MSAATLGMLGVLLDLGVEGVCAGGCGGGVGRRGDFQILEPVTYHHPCRSTSHQDCDVSFVVDDRAEFFTEGTNAH